MVAHGNRMNSPQIDCVHVPNTHRVPDRIPRDTMRREQTAREAGRQSCRGTYSYRSDRARRRHVI